MCYFLIFSSLIDLLYERLRAKKTNKGVEREKILWDIIIDRKKEFFVCKKTLFLHPHFASIKFTPSVLFTAEHIIRSAKDVLIFSNLKH